VFIPDNVFGNITPPIPSFSEVKISLVEFDKVDPFSLERGEANLLETNVLTVNFYT
jgi:hypothetical protein